MERFSDLDMYYFGQATHYDIYKKLGAHPITEKGQKGVYFAVWAPHAAKMSVVGDFNGCRRGVLDILKNGAVYTKQVTLTMISKKYSKSL